MTLLPGALTQAPTADGSFTLFSEDFGEWFHSREGAYTEAYTTYVQTTDLAQLARTGQITLLDVCYGLGYNSAAALTTLQQVNPGAACRLVGLELDPRVPQQAVNRGLISPWPAPVQQVLAQLATAGVYQQHPLTAQLYLGDARQTIQILVKQGFQADVIFLDPFSPPHCPELWTVEFIQQVADCLAPQGRLATYSCAAAVRTALGLAGLALGPTLASGRRWPGPLAQWPPHGLAPRYPPEQGPLLARAAVPYRDPSLGDSADRIRQRRQQEQARSPLTPTSIWRKRWLAPYPPSI